ncbi:hypothetical protein Sjap_004015 [Stephania japonica]|uniref:Uncharacterized protein n=1 Tax=Stephania japonica TaxID=461633 RepID=A0AAP0PHF0_9MAGN
MAFNNKPKKPTNLSTSQSMKTMKTMKTMNLRRRTSLAFILLFTALLALLLLLLHYQHRGATSAACGTCRVSTTAALSWRSGDLRHAEFAWNRLPFTDNYQSPPLRIAVFSRKWPVNGSPGGMERHALTLYTALARRRGHQIHVFTSPPSIETDQADQPGSPQIHFHEGLPGQWRYNLAWKQFQEENKKLAFDVIHSESVALPHWLARDLPNLAVSWHGIALESLQSTIYQDLARRPNEPISTTFNASLYGVVPKVLKEIRFFKNYANHVAISDSCGEMLRDVYQIPSKRVHVILNGVNEAEFEDTTKVLGMEFRLAHKVPLNASLVMGVAGRLVKDKGHPLLYQSFTSLLTKHPDVYLIVAGSGPWEQRYREMGERVVVLGSLHPSELKGFYNAIDVFVNPTLRPQGLDLTLMEAMMCGKPVLASRFPSIKGSVVVSDEFGFMFSPNVESLLEALLLVVGEGKERLQRMGKACAEYARSMFTAQKMALAYERLFLCIKDETFCHYS